MKKKKNQSDGKIRVMLVDDHAGIREALRRVINSTSDLAVVAEADGGRSAVDLLQRVNADVVLMDGSMPEMSGMETTYLLKRLQPSVKVIGLTLYEEATYVDEMVAAGASGYVLKTGETESLMKAIRVVAAGDTYFEKLVSPRFSENKQDETATAELSAEELTVVKRVADGYTNAEIAADSRLEVADVDRHRTAAMKKLNVRSRAELVRVARRRHWL
ncbi:MAG TPA: response regulator transcription factor [Candidatus Udaeobacter sp.]|jgi:DNA-binding NarL/FixJ family response regulator|nr:response regulator transcription factor [Candidatus Udaeobacter sp.]